MPVNRRGVWEKPALMILIGLLIYMFIDKYVLDSVIKRSLPVHEAGLLAGILMGGKEGIGKETFNNFQESGLVHLLVVSGSNIMLLVGGSIEQAAKLFGRKWAIIAGLLAGWSYAAMVGWEIPVVRAMLLMSFLYWAQLWGRRFYPVRAVVLSVVIFVLGEWKILSSLSFWLSMSAYVGVITYKKRNRFDSFWETLWVSLWISPILAIAVGKISVVSPLTNMLAVGIVEILTVVGMAGAVAGVFCEALGRAILWLTIPGLKLLGAIAWMGGGGAIEISFNYFMLIGWYLILLFILMRQKLIFDK